MSKFRSLGVAAVFLAGCAVGGASARFVVPPASAQQAASLTKWDYMCFETYNVDKIVAQSKEAGAQGWEMVTTQGIPGAPVWCFKRPKT
jgi:hypothetical protein